MIVGITPARGGSKGIPGKNIKEIAGRPLISWTIERALQSKLIDKYFVSTDDPHISRISKKWGAQVLKRPPELATDESLVIDTLKYHLEKDFPTAKTIVLLQCTSPIRDPELIDYCIQQYKDSAFDSLATGFLINPSRITEYGTTMARRQDMKSYFHDDGNVYVINSNLIRKGQLFNENLMEVEIPKFQNLEIDDEDDFWIAEQILKKPQ